MNTENPIPTRRTPSLLRNWISLTGLVIIIGSLFSFLLLFFFDTIAHFSNPYIGLLTYVIAPGFLFLGLFLGIVGVLRARKKLGQSVGLLPKVVVDLSRPRDRKIMGLFIAGTIIFLLLSAVGSYHTYHFTESVQFCGQACHTVMKPELVTYEHGSHARVACVQCHIGPGAEWFVKAKISGTYQLYAVAFNKYPRPVPTPIKNLRPAQETCEQCHWPKKFVGNLDRTYNYFLGEETNTPFSVRLTMKVGGGDPTHGPVGGIHWHMNVGNQVQYYAATNVNGTWIADEQRQSIPWVRIVNSQGVVTEFRKPNFTNAVPESELRTMDCMDCHNRPAHKYMSPDKAVNLAMSLEDQIDRTLPWIKTNAVYALTRNYTNETLALQGIATILAAQYPADRFPTKQESVRKTIGIVQRIYRDNFFPEMKASWDKYPDNIGHMIWPGCFRCHDGKHIAADGKRSIKASDCNTCHTILAQGSGAELNLLTPGGQKFKHPGDEVDGACNDCHTGGL
ncbi:MAG: NapC/NirT family cytochrome c [Verrucomicrobia bacterium]|nr:NapC/NirT family cytochrome c [Verrucomicrobiota bacterium]